MSDKKVLSPPSFESKIAKSREYYEELIDALKAQKQPGWRKEVKHAKDMIKTLDKIEDLRRLEELRSTCNKQTKRWMRWMRWMKNQEKEKKK